MELFDTQFVWFGQVFPVSCLKTLVTRDRCKLNRPGVSSLHYKLKCLSLECASWNDLLMTHFHCKWKKLCTMEQLCSMAQTLRHDYNACTDWDDASDVARCSIPTMNVFFSFPTHDCTFGNAFLIKEPTWAGVVASLGNCCKNHCWMSDTWTCLNYPVAELCTQDTKYRN